MWSGNRLLLEKLPDRAAVQLAYLARFRRLPDLTHPKTLNEKLAWRKLYQHDTRFVIFSDKVAVKDEIAKLVGERYVIETLWTGTDPASIPFAVLKPPYVVKTNHGSGKHIFVRTE